MMKSVRFRLFILLTLLLFIPAQAGLLDRLKSPTGVYTYEENVVYGANLEEIDVRSDKTFIWKFTRRINFPNVPLYEEVTYIRGRWRSSYGDVSLFTDEKAKGAILREFTIDDGDLIEKSELKRRFAKKK